MTNSTSTRLLYAALAVALVAWLVVGRSSDAEAQIRARLETVRELVAKEPGEKALESADRARQLAAMLADGFVLHLDPIGQQITDAAALARPFVGLRRQAERIEVDFSGIEVELAAGERRAVSTHTASVHASGGDGRRGAYRVTVGWVRSDAWKIEEMRVEETLRGGSFLGE